MRLKNTYLITVSKVQYRKDPETKQMIKESEAKVLEQLVENQNLKDVAAKVNELVR